MRNRPKNRRKGIRVSLCNGSGVVLSTGEYESGKLAEIFLDARKEGSFTRDVLQAVAILISVGLQHGIPLSEFAHSLRNHDMEPDLLREIFRELEEHYKE
jgi:ribonucleoside-diphosphate reductase alpha chain